MNEEANKETLKTLKKLDEAYKTFLDSPTAKNLELFIQLSNKYTENWIQDASNDANLKISSKDLDSIDFKKLNSKKESLIKDVKPVNIGKFLQRTEIGRVEGNMGLDHFISRSNYYPPLKDLNNKDLHYIDHSFKSSRYHEKLDKFFNRRWYVESDSVNFEGDAGPKLPWELIRTEFNIMAEEANLQGLFNDQMNDERIIDGKVIFSSDLDLEDRKRYFNEITLPEERKYFIDRDVDFVIYESKYPKKPSQYITSDPESNVVDIETENGECITLKNPPSWRDVCIFNPDLITFRSLTNDLSFKPKILIPDSRNWVMSNDMPYFSNQAIKVFLKYTHPRMRIKTFDQEIISAENTKISIDADLQFKIGSKYSRSDVHYYYNNEPLPSIGTGRWTTGYVIPKGSNDLIIFMNVGVPGKTGHDFNNSYDEENKIVTWYGQNKAHSKQPTFNKLIKGELTPHLFARTNNKDNFIYLGSGSIIEYEDGVETKDGKTIEVKFACQQNIDISIDGN